jgi:hypothetical protein
MPPVRGGGPTEATYLAVQGVEPGTRPYWVPS